MTKIQRIATRLYLGKLKVARLLKKRGELGISKEEAKYQAFRIKNGY